MKVYGLSVVGSMSKQSSTSEPKEDAALHSHDNIHVLARLTSDAEGRLLFDGQPIEGGGLDLSNADDLARLAVDENGQLTIDGTVVSGGSSSAPMSVTKLGSGTALVKSVIGSDIQTRSLVAGTNVTLDVSGDEVKINASLSGSVSASTTFTKSDDFTRSAQVISLSYASKLRAIEPSISDSGLVFQATLCDDTNASMNGGALSSRGTASTIVETSLFRNERALKCSGGCLVVPEGTTASVTAPSTWFSGTKDWCIELEFALDTSKLGTTQNLASNYTDSYANASLWIGIGTDNCPYVGIGYGATVTQSLSIRSSVALTDGSKHHIAVVRQGSTYTMYVDGVSRGTATSASSNNAPAYGFYLGSSVSSGSPVTPFYGYLRAVRVWNFAKYTAAFPMPALSYPITGDAHLDMAGKLLPASFWKQVSSMSVVSNETATAYLKWLMVDVNGYWVWDSANSVWSAVDIANITSVGMTTAEVKAAFTNNPWNYRSDSVGFAVALVTTDGASTPVLTSITLNAVQSADKTAGHTVLTSAGQAAPQRNSLQFKDFDVLDVEGVTQVIGYKTDVLGLKTTVAALQETSGTIGGRAVSNAAPQDGSVLMWRSDLNAYAPAVVAEGAAGNGLYMTAVLDLAAGEDIAVSHQNVTGGRAVYQVEEVVSAGSEVRRTDMRSTLSTDLEQSNYECNCSRKSLRLPATAQMSSKTVGSALPKALTNAVVYQVDDTVYVAGGRNASGVSKTIYSAPVSTMVFTDTGIVLPANICSIDQNSVVQIGSYLYLHTGFLGSSASGLTADTSVYRASVSDPTNWSLYGTSNIKVGSSSRFLIGDYVYVCGGFDVNSVYNTIYRTHVSDLLTYELVGTLPTYMHGGSSYQYRGYIYILGGRSGSASSASCVYSNKIYRASIEDPATWTQIGTMPTASSYHFSAVVGDKVLITALRSSSTSFSATAYVTEADDPTTWTPTTAASVTAGNRMSHVVDNVVYALGGSSSSTNATCTAVVDIWTFGLNVSATSGYVTLPNTAMQLISSITSISVAASIPANTNIVPLFSSDGVDWKGYVGDAWVSLQEAEYSTARSLTGSGTEYSVQGLSSLTLTDNMKIKFWLIGTSTATPMVYSVDLAVVNAEFLIPLLVGGDSNPYVDIVLKYVRAESYAGCTVVNKTQRSMSLRVKIYDGALAQQL